MLNLCEFLPSTRLSRSPHAPEFVLKGALMLRVWNVSIARPTLDIDLDESLD